MQDHRNKQQDVQIVVQRRLQTPEEVTVSFFELNKCELGWKVFYPRAGKANELHQLCNPSGEKILI